MDKVIIKDLLVRGIIGVNDWERNRAQDILINITLFTDTRRAAETDNINDCVNYSTMSKRIQAHAERAERLTVEALANDLAEIHPQYHNPLTREVILKTATRLRQNVWLETRPDVLSRFNGGSSGP